MRSELLAASIAAAAAVAAAAEAVPVERILAVVDDRPVLLSEVRLVEALRGIDRAAAVDALIDEQLMYRQAARLPQSTPTPEEEEAAFQSVLARLSADEAPDREAIRDLARRQARILKYVDFRFRPLARIDPDSVSVAGPAEGEAAADQLRRRSAEDLDQRLEEWVAELRAVAQIRYVPPSEGE
jgi:hypothetical protein